MIGAHSGAEMGQIRTFLKLQKPHSLLKLLWSASSGKPVGTRHPALRLKQEEERFFKSSWNWQEGEPCPPGNREPEAAKCPEGRCPKAGTGAEPPLALPPLGEREEPWPVSARRDWPVP